MTKNTTSRKTKATPISKNGQQYKKKSVQKGLKKRDLPEMKNKTQEIQI